MKLETIKKILIEDRERGIELLEEYEKEHSTEYVLNILILNYIKKGEFGKVLTYLEKLEKVISDKSDYYTYLILLSDYLDIDLHTSSIKFSDLEVRKNSNRKQMDDFIRESIYLHDYFTVRTILYHDHIIYGSLSEKSDYIIFSLIRLNINKIVNNIKSYLDRGLYGEARDYVEKNVKSKSMRDILISYINVLIEAYAGKFISKNAFRRMEHVEAVPSVLMDCFKEQTDLENGLNRYYFYTGDNDYINSFMYDFYVNYNNPEEMEILLSDYVYSINRHRAYDFLHLMYQELPQDVFMDYAYNLTHGIDIAWLVQQYEETHEKIYARLIKIAKRLRKRTNTTVDNDFEIELEDEDKTLLQQIPIFSFISPTIVKSPATSP